jgi:hypothetical protein
VLQFTVKRFNLSDTFLHCGVYNSELSLITDLGRTIAEAVSRWLLTAAGLASGICSGKSGVGTGFLRVLRFPLPEPFILPTSPSSQSPGAETQRPCDELITRPRNSADCPRSSNRNETESFMEAAKAQNWAVEPQDKKIIDPVESFLRS